LTDKQTDPALPLLALALVDPFFILRASILASAAVRIPPETERERQNAQQNAYRVRELYRGRFDRFGRRM
jgi:hypothetical protein